MIYIRSPEIDSTQNSQIYTIACKTNITHKYSMYYTLMIIPLCIKGNNSQFQMDKNLMDFTLKLIRVKIKIEFHNLRIFRKHSSEPKRYQPNGSIKIYTK